MNHEERVESKTTYKKSAYDYKSRSKKLQHLETSKSRSKTNERKQSRNENRKAMSKADASNVQRERVDSLESDDEDEPTESKSPLTERPATTNKPVR